MADVLDAEQPDLAVLTGDVIDGKHSGTRLPPGICRCAACGRGIAWAAVFGNRRRGSMTTPS